MSLRRPTLRFSGRQARGSLLIVALMLAAFGVVFPRYVLPAWQEHALLEKRAEELDTRLETKRQAAKDLQDKIGALDDAYYLAIILPDRYGWRWQEGSDAWKTRHGMAAQSSTVQK